MRARNGLLSWIWIAGMLICGPLLRNGAQAQTDWTTFGFNTQHTGFNPNERTLSTANVGTMGLLWESPILGHMLTQPTLLTNVATAQGQKNLLYGATLEGKMFALNAATGNVVWQTTLPSVQTNCDDFSATGGVVGVIDTPTIDRGNKRMFVVAGDGALHALNIADGTEMAGFPLQVMSGADAPPHTLVYGSPTLDATHSWLYIATASACDAPPWRGQVIKVGVSTPPTVLQRWYSVQNQDISGGGIWGPGGVSITPDLSRIDALTGNAATNPENPPYADAVVALDPQNLNLAAANLPALTGTNLDFGATPLLYSPAGCPNEIAAMNKSGALFIYDQSDTAINNGPRQRIQISGTDNTLNGNFVGVPAYDPGRRLMFLGNPSDSTGVYQHGLIALLIQPGCSAALKWQVQVGLNNVDYNNPMIPPTVANGVVYYADGDASQVFAFNADTGQQLWSTGSLVTGGVFAAPMVVNGLLFVSGYGDEVVFAFGLGGSPVPAVASQ